MGLAVRTLWLKENNCQERMPQTDFFNLITSGNAADSLRQEEKL
ncbi:hypothetical protein [Clostridium sp. KNHs205]|jgi:hypothetical protein|nr:hypothetical protein [Clostridium sp. KNHs205]